MLPIPKNMTKVALVQQIIFVDTHKIFFFSTHRTKLLETIPSSNWDILLISSPLHFMRLSPSLFHGIKMSLHPLIKRPRIRSSRSIVS